MNSTNSGIFDINNGDDFDFSKLFLTSPVVNLGNNYFIKFIINQMPLYIHSPICSSKQNIFKSGKKLYCDLLFTNNNIHFINWIEQLETYCQKYIYENREKWFETDLELYDIENSMTSPLKLFKSGKYYLMRTSVPSVLGKCSLKIFDELENEIIFEAIKENTNLQTILEFKGIKCSARNFSFEIEIKQIMVLNPTNMFDKCVIKVGSVGEARHTMGVRRTPEKPTTPSLIYENNEVIEEIHDITPPTSRSVFVEDVYEEKLHDDIVEKLHDDIVEPLYTPEKLHDNIVEPLYTPDKLHDNTEPIKLIEDIKSSIIVENNNIENNSIKYLEEKQENINPEEDEFVINIDELPEKDTVVLTERKDIYYEMYSNAKQKFKEAKYLALNSFLEAKNIKNTYNLENLDDPEWTEWINNE
jgi:hypothetical protein